MSTLLLSVHGPFLYRFAPNTVEIYAAKCLGHTAGLFTAKNEVPLTGRHRQGNSRSYRLTGPVFKPPNPLPPVRFYDPDNTILNVPSSARPVFENSYFCVIVPLPQTVVPTSSNEVEIIDNSTNPPGKPTGNLTRQATGLRLYYDADLSKNLMLTLDGSSAPVWISDFDAALLGHDFADAEIRYASVKPEDQEHQDALECFDHIAAIAGLDWWACYDDPAHPHGIQPFVKAGHDCKSAILAIR
jgi:hypothetical protein